MKPVLKLAVTVKTTQNVPDETPLLLPGKRCLVLFSVTPGSPLWKVNYSSAFLCHLWNVCWGNLLSEE